MGGAGCWRTCRPAGKQHSHLADLRGATHDRPALPSRYVLLPCACHSQAARRRISPRNVSCHSLYILPRSPPCILPRNLLCILPRIPPCLTPQSMSCRIPLTVYPAWAASCPASCRVSHADSRFVSRTSFPWRVSHPVSRLVSCLMSPLSLIHI